MFHVCGCVCTVQALLGFSCGLVALNMVLTHLTGVSLNPADVLSQAVNRNFTKKGEMFSGSKNAVNLQM